MTFAVGVPEDFHFWRTVYSHGWCALPPFSVEDDARRMRLTLRLSSGKVVPVAVRQSGARRLIAESDAPVRPEEQREIKALLRSCFRLDEDFSEFYAEARRHPRFRWIPKTGSGRMLRAPTVFEDLVKMICTTNCSWALTEIMVKNLCAELGANGRGNAHAFPEPEAIAGCTESFLRKKIRAGYRAPYLLELSRRIAKKSIDPESWRESRAPTGELFEEVRSVKGVGPYAAGNVLKLLGRYDYLGIDSWCRKRFYDLHRKGRKVSDKSIGKFYAPFGKWQGLFFWMDMTKDWHAEKKGD